MEKSQPRASLVRADSHRDVSPARVANDANADCFYSFLEEMLHRSRLASPDLFLAPDFRDHFGNELRDRIAFVTSLSEHLTHIPDAAWTIQILVSVGDVVICHLTTRRANIDRDAWENFVVRFDGGKMVECWRSCHWALPGAAGSDLYQ